MTGARAMGRRWVVVNLLSLTVLVSTAHAAESDRWTRMTHGFAFLTSNRQGGPSGDQDFESQNHIMTMASRPLGGGTLTLLGTFTLEPLTIPREGSPLLFQRGETFDDVL